LALHGSGAEHSSFGSGGNLGLALVRAGWPCISDPRFQRECRRQLSTKTGQQAVLVKDPQPAMLPIIAEESTEYVTELAKPVSYCTERHLDSLDQYLETLKHQARAWDLILPDVYRYETILAVEKNAKTAFNDFAGSELRAALKAR
jgi:hypothetical protein